MHLNQDNAFEAFKRQVHRRSEPTQLSASSVVLVESGTLALQLSDGAFRLRKGDIRWIPAGVTHHLFGKTGKLAVLRIRKRAFVPEQVTDANARRVIVQLESWVRAHNCKLPREVDRLVAGQHVRNCVDAAMNPLALKAHALLLLAYLSSTTPEVNGVQDMAAAPKRIQEFLAYMREHYNDPLRIQDATRITRLSPAHFHRCFQDATGTSFTRYLNRQRISVAKQLLRQTNRDILDIAFSCGFQSTSRFYQVFGELVGTSPKAFRTQANR